MLESLPKTEQDDINERYRVVARQSDKKWRA
jgi:hypothetical protein